MVGDKPKDSVASVWYSGEEPFVSAIDELNRGFYRALLDGLEDCVYFVNRDRRILFWNKAAERTTGFDFKEVIRRECPDNILCHVDEFGRALCTDGCPLSKVMHTGLTTEIDVYLRHKNGHRVPVRVKAIPIRDRDGSIVGAVELFHDRSSRQDKEDRIKELEQLALIDELTHLPNRRHFDLQLQHRLNELDRYNWRFGLLMIDIDLFKPVNDRFGHQTGDEILKLVAWTLNANCRLSDLVVRWGGEEFAVIVRSVEETELVLVAEKLRTMVAANNLRLPNENIAVTISIGGTMARHDDTADSLVKRADRFLYQAKHQGRNCFSIG